MKRPSQVDVAKLAGVSRATVSYVIHNQTDGPIPISDETRKRVLDAIDALGYVPDASAQALRLGSTKTIGLIIPDIHNPHFWQVADGVEQAADAAGYHMLLSSIPPENKFAEDFFKNLSNRRIDGLVMIPSFIYQSEEAQKTLGILIKRGFPVVSMMGDHGAKYEKMDRVISDYREITVDVMSHLLSLGHTRIGIIFGIAVPTLGSDRLDAYQESLIGAGIEVDPDLIVECGPQLEDSYNATMKLLNLPSRPTAILAINDLLAVGALRAINDFGLTVPDDISLFGYDDMPFSQYLVPRLSTASKYGEKMGREAIRLLLNRFNDPDLPPQKVKLSAQLILRESTGPAPKKG